MKITTTEVTVWITDMSSVGPGDFQDGMSVDGLSFYSLDMTSAGWTRAGVATITMEVMDRQNLVESKVESLRAQQTKTLADAQAEATRLEGKIQKLLAITYEGA